MLYFVKNNTGLNINDKILSLNFIMMQRRWHVSITVTIKSANGNYIFMNRTQIRHRLDTKWRRKKKNEFLQIILYIAETSAVIMGYGGCRNLLKKRKTRDRSRACQNNLEQFGQIFDNLLCSVLAPMFC